LPLPDGILRSAFGVRKHPILGYAKMHTGVDWAAPHGTQIFAAGNGVVEKVGWEGGYGKYVRMKHNNGYETAYGHMSAYAKGMEPGKRVRQGQVIGFVGSTGMSTGPHLHYEFHRGGRPVNPLAQKFAMRATVGGKDLARFQALSRQYLAQLKSAPAAADMSNKPAQAKPPQTKTSQAPKEPATPQLAKGD